MAIRYKMSIPCLLYVPRHEFPDDGTYGATLELSMPAPVGRMSVFREIRSIIQELGGSVPQEEITVARVGEELSAVHPDWEITVSLPGLLAKSGLVAHGNYDVSYELR